MQLHNPPNLKLRDNVFSKREFNSINGKNNTHTHTLTLILFLLVLIVHNQHFLDKQSPKKTVRCRNKARQEII